MVRDTREVRATGLQGDASPEIIEIIDDDTDAFGDRAHTLTIHDTGGPRWVGPVAAGVLIALIGYGVATSASSSGAPKAAPVTSTSLATTTTQPAPTTTVPPPPPVPYYAADPPREFTVQYAELQQLGSVDFGGGSYELWATPGASATSGSWFSVMTYPGASNLYAPDSYRVQTGDLTIAISHTPGGQATAQFSPEGYAAVTITSFGWSDADLVRLAASIRTNGDSVDFTDPSLIPGFQMISSVQPWLAVQGFAVEQIYYESSDTPSAGVAITIAQRPPANEGGSTLDRQIALRFFLDRNTPFGVDGHSAVAGSLIAQSGYPMATWIDGENIVTVSATMPLPQLIAIARTVHQVSADEWEGMKFQAVRNNDNNGNNPNDVEQSETHPVSFGADPGSEPWTIRVSMATYGNQRQINWGWSGAEDATTPDDTTQINTVVDDKRTYVLADLPRAIAPTAELHVLRNGLDPVVVPFNDVDPELDRTFAAYAFSESVAYTAQIIGPDGSVLATWPSP